VKVLVGVLHSGEAEYQRCLESIHTQQGVNLCQFVISGKANKEAHDELYATFMARASDFDFFFKLDADMTLRAPNSLRALIDLAASKRAAHALSYVMDFPSSLAIPGVQLFRSDSCWEGSDDRLNVDYSPKLFGPSVMVIDPIFVDHMSAPSDYQLFRYGIHKALKSIQHGRGAKKSVQKGLLHTAVINGIARNYSAGRNELIWALIGARLVYDGGVPVAGYHSDEVMGLHERLKHSPSTFKSVSYEAQQFFSNEVQNWFRWLGKYQST
jgi:hypothetical protein